MILLAAAATAACQKSDEGASSPASSRVRIDPIITRATDVNFEEGDRIGLTIRKGAASYAENGCLTFAGNLFSGDLVWYAEAAEPSTLVAYYPYDEAGAPEKFSVATDQTAGYGASDLMASVKEEVTPTSGAVSMVFKHLLTKLVINVQNETGSDIGAVRLRNSIPTAVVDLMGLGVEADAAAAPAEIEAQPVTANEVYRAIVVPQEVAFTLAVETVAGKTLTQELKSVDLVQGGQYTYDVRVTPDGLKVAVTGEIEDWTDEGELRPAGDEAAFEEHLDENYFLYDGERYATVRLANNTVWMAEPLRYLPDGFAPSADPKADAHIWYPYELSNPNGPTGINAESAMALTDAESIRKNGYFYDMYAALGGVEVTVENCYDFEGAQGICPKGWHIPTRAELWNLCGLSNKAAEGESGNQINEEALFYDENYGGGRWTLYNEAGWNYVLSGVMMVTNFASEPRYQLTQLYPGNNSLGEDYYGMPGLTYIMSSTCYKPIYSTSEPGSLTNIQFFSQMTTFSKSYPEGRINVSYIGILSGQQLRCVRDAAE